jgi:hypothetical protein
MTRWNFANRIFYVCGRDRSQQTSQANFKIFEEIHILFAETHAADLLTNRAGRWLDWVLPCLPRNEVLLGFGLVLSVAKFDVRVFRVRRFVRIPINLAAVLLSPLHSLSCRKRQFGAVTIRVPELPLTSFKSEVSKGGNLLISLLLRQVFEGHDHVKL